MKTNHDTSEASDSFTNLVREAVNNEPLPPADPALREAVLKRLDQPLVEPALSAEVAARRRTFFQRVGIALVSTAALAVAAVIWQQPLTNVVGLAEPANRPAGSALGDRRPGYQPSATSTQPASHLPRVSGDQGEPLDKLEVLDQPVRETNQQKYESSAVEGTKVQLPAIVASTESATAPNKKFENREELMLNQLHIVGEKEGIKGRPAAADSTPAPAEFGNESGQGQGSNSSPLPRRRPEADDRLQTGPAPDATIREYDLAKRMKEGKTSDAPPANQPLDSRNNRYAESLQGGIESAPAIGEGRQKHLGTVARNDGLTAGKTLERLVEEKQGLVKDEKAIKELAERDGYFRYYAAPGGEQYAKIIENQFLNPNIEEYARSTFSIDVDTASYANVRRFLTSGQLPPPDAVRLEEMVNYFKYKYPQPKGDDPFSINMEMADCPWQPGHKLLRVGLQGKEIHRAERPASNIVFLIDTSGSMTDQNKLPLLKDAFKMLVGELNENDKITMVTYAGNAGLRLPPTRGHEKETIIAAIDGLQSGGSTHGSAGIQLAYEVAAAQFVKGGTNKVILATDGDLNVGITDDAALVELITKKAETGVFLTVLGVGTGNLKDAKMERLADNGNGIYAYLDSVREARKVLVEEMSGSLVTIAQDVKIQLEFNPAHIASYRLLGYENRVMANQDFRNDAKDAGEIGAGHSVTAMYEVVMAGAPDVKAPGAKPAGEPLRYQRAVELEAPKKELTEAGKSGELLMVRLRYKKPEAKKEDAAKEVEYPLTDKGGSFNSASKEFQFASAVVAFGLSLRQSEFRGSTNLSAVAEMAQPALGEDNGGHRAEFLDLVRRAKSLRGE
jgi:Ca-activated chloride channel family protein